MKNKFSSLKNGGDKIIFCVTLMCTLIFSSCNKEEKVLSSAVPKPNETPEQYIERRMAEVKASGKTVTVEHATLEEINAVMRQYNLPEVTRAEIDQAKGLRNCPVYNCSWWEELGDWNGNGVFSTFDLVLYNQFMNSIGQDPNTGIDDILYRYDSGGFVPDGAWGWCVLNTFNCTDDGYFYNLSGMDKTSAFQYLIGILDCN